MAGPIVISEGDGRGGIPADLVGDVHRSWMQFLVHLEDARSKNNNLKEWIARAKNGLDELYAIVRALPPQGRQVTFTMTALARVAGQLRGEVTPPPG